MNVIPDNEIRKDTTMNNLNEICWVICQNREQNFYLESPCFDSLSQAKEYVKNNAGHYKKPEKGSCAIIPFYSEDLIFARTKIKRIRDLGGRHWRIPDNERVNEKNFENIQRALDEFRGRSIWNMTEVSRLQKEISKMEANLARQEYISLKASLYQSLMGFFLGTTIGSFLVFSAFASGWI